MSHKFPRRAGEHRPSEQRGSELRAQGLFPSLQSLAPAGGAEGGQEGPTVMTGSTILPATLGCSDGGEDVEKWALSSFLVRNSFGKRSGSFSQSQTHLQATTPPGGPAQEE